MNGHSPLEFRFTGQLLRDGDSPPDERVLGAMLEQRSRITEEIQRQLRDEIADELGIEVDVDVRIRFEEGSVLFSGFVAILGVMATVAGAVDFVQKMIWSIRRVVRLVLGRRAFGRRVRIRVYPAFEVGTIPAAVPPASGREQFLSAKTVLLAVTLLNTAIFIGGSVYTGISVTSIQEKYAKAESEIERVRQDYEKYRAGLQDRLGDIEGQLRATAKETSDTRDRVNRLSEELALLDKQTQDLEASVAAFRERGASWVSLRVAYRQSNWVLKLYLIAVPLCSLAILAAVIRLTWEWVK